MGTVAAGCDAKQDRGRVLIASSWPDRGRRRWADTRPISSKDVDVQAKGGATERGGHSGAFELKVEPHMGRAELTFVVPDRKGTYEIGCFLPGHYEAGMKGTITVE
jgi:plastocyanin